MLYKTCYITFAELLYNIQVWLYNIQDGYITHPNLPEEIVLEALSPYGLGAPSGTLRPGLASNCQRPGSSNISFEFRVYSESSSLASHGLLESGGTLGVT